MDSWLRETLPLRNILTLPAGIKNFWFYDLRSKAADDKADAESESEALKLLGHTDGRTTARHYLAEEKLSARLILLVHISWRPLDGRLM